MAVKQEYYTPATMNQYQSAGGTNKFQTFVAESTYSISEIKLKLKRSSGAPHYLYGVYLYAVDGSHLPTGSALATFRTFYLDTDLTTSYVVYTFDDTTYEVTNTVEYAIVVSTTEEITTSSLRWWTDTDGSYATGYCGNGNYILGWSTISYDRWFENYGGDSPPGKARFPSPVDNKIDVRVRGVDIVKRLEWAPPSNEIPDYKLYFRQYSDAWVHYADIPYSITASYTLLPSIVLGYYTIYEWRVDTVANELTTTGDTWTFTTEVDRRWTEFGRRSDYDTDEIPDKVWIPGGAGGGGVGVPPEWVDPEDPDSGFEYTGGGRFKNRIVVMGHGVIYFGDV